MKKGTKKLIIRTIRDRIEEYERSIHYCQKIQRTGFEDHIKKLNGKVERLNSAILELEGFVSTESAQAEPVAEPGLAKERRKTDKRRSAM